MTSTTSTTYTSRVFSLETMDVPGGTETILRGGRHLFPLLPQAFDGVRRIGVKPVIEAVDSLLPYMHARNVAHMVDNCSRTARLGARRWGPRFQTAYEQIAYPAAERPADEALLTAFDTHPVHEALSAAAKLRPSVDISVA